MEILLINIVLGIFSNGISGGGITGNLKTRSYTFFGTTW
jgi:hypothetical protein